MGHDPDDPRNDDGQEDRPRYGEIASANVRIETCQNGTDLQADEHEGEHIEHEDGGVPDGVGRQAEPRRHAFRGSTRDRDGVTHHRQHAREAEPVGQDPDAERDDELKDDGGRHVPDLLRDPQSEPRQDRTGDDTAGNHQEKGGSRRTKGKGVHRHGADGQPVDQQGTRVVEQALPLENRQDAMRWPQLPQDRRRRGRIGGRHDGAERDGRRPWHGRHESARHNGDGQRGQDDADQRETHDGDPVVLEIARRCVVRRVQQHRRDEQRQRHLRLDRERRRSRHESQDGADERQKRGVWRADLAGRRRQKHRHEQNADELFELTHSNGSARARRISGALR